MAHPGRPRLPDDQRPVCQNVRLTPATADAVCRYALHHNISVYALLGQVIELVFAKWIIPSSTVLAYRQHVTVQIVRTVNGSLPSSCASTLVGPLVSR